MSRRFGKNVVPVILALCAVLLVLVSVVAVLAKHLDIRLGNNEMQQVTLKMVNVIIAMMGLGFAALYFTIQSRLKKIDEVEELHKHIVSLAGILVESNIYELPPLSYTQHIPFERFKIFQQIEEAFTFRNYFYKEHDKTPSKLSEHKKNFICGINSFCRREFGQAVVFLKEAKNIAELPEIKIQALWRLGIAYRQERHFEKSLEIFDELERTATRGSELWSSALRGRMLTYYAAYNKENKYKTSVWGVSSNCQQLLALANNEFKELWNEGFRDPQFVSFYGALVKNERGKTDEAEGLLKYTIEESLVDEKLYPHNEDYAIQADFYFSMAICHELLRRKAEKDNLNDLKKDCMERRNNCAKKAKRFAELVQSDYSDYDMIYSEKELRDVSAGQFLGEIPKEWLE